MNLSKKIEISRSTFISLKAELLRKQEEVSKAKQNTRNQIENFVPSSKFSSSKESTNSAAEEIKKPPDAEEAEALRKSKEALERKTKLYDHLSKGSTSSEGRDDLFLVQFDKKRESQDLSVPGDSTTTKCDSEDNVDDFEEEDNEWVDYVDCLGRTRRCHKSDLDHVKKRDESLKNSLNPDREPSPTIEPKKFVREDESPPKDLLPPDAYKEMLRQQWEQKEQELMKKDTVHYEDVLFNESRTHGVGYYALSGDAAERTRQQAELAQARKDTERARLTAAAARARREEALQARVKAARARQRARAGLPPEEDEEKPSPVTAMLLDFVEEQKKASSEKAAEEARLKREAKEMEAQKAREKFVREWDEGKTNQHYEMTQEQWVDKKRKERHEEFAPPVEKSRRNREQTFDPKGYYEDTEGNKNQEPYKQPTWNDVRPMADYPSTSSSRELPDKSLFFTTKKQTIADIKNKYFVPVSTPVETFVPVPIRNECGESEDNDAVDDDAAEDAARKMTGNDASASGRKGVEIEPPSTYEYYGPPDKKQKKQKMEATSVGEAFAQGVHFLEQQAANKDKKKNRAYLDDM